MPAALYNIPDPRERAAQHMQGAVGSYARQMPNIKTPGAPPKTAGGAIMNVAGGAATGASLGGMMTSAGAAGSSAGPWGAAIGAVVGAAAYFLS